MCVCVCWGYKLYGIFSSLILLFNPLYYSVIREKARNRRNCMRETERHCEVMGPSRKPLGVQMMKSGIESGKRPLILLLLGSGTPRAGACASCRRLHCDSGVLLS